MNEHDVLINAINRLQEEEGYQNFDELVVNEFFSEIIEVGDISRWKTDSYGDAGVEYIFYTCNRKHFYEFEDIDELIVHNQRNNVIDFYFIQIKDTRKLDSNVVNKFVEFSNNLSSGEPKDHYNKN